jgi:hypothetical protein
MASPQLLLGVFQDKDSVFFLVRGNQRHVHHKLYLHSMPFASWVELERLVLAMVCISGTWPTGFSSLSAHVFKEFLIMQPPVPLVLLLAHAHVHASTQSSCLARTLESDARATGTAMVAAVNACKPNFIVAPLIFATAAAGMLTLLSPLLEPLPSVWSSALAIAKQTLILVDVALDGSVALFVFAFVYASWRRTPQDGMYRNGGPLCDTRTHPHKSALPALL